MITMATTITAMMIPTKAPNPIANGPILMLLCFFFEPAILLSL